MKNIFLPKVMMCIIALFTLILPASATSWNVYPLSKQPVVGNE